MKKYLCVLVCICLLLTVGLLGCGTESAQQTPGSSTTNPSAAKICPMTVRIDGENWRDWGYRALDITIEDSEILGYITSVVSISSVPTQDNEANYENAKDAPYARWTHEEYGEIYVIRYGKGWHVLLPADYPVSD